MTFNEWWEATKNLEKVGVPDILKKALKDLAYEAWCESRYQQNVTKTLLGFYPTHLKVWADDLEEDIGYISQLVKFLRTLGEKLEEGKIKEV